MMTDSFSSVESFRDVMTYMHGLDLLDDQDFDDITTEALCVYHRTLSLVTHYLSKNIASMNNVLFSRLENRQNSETKKQGKCPICEGLYIGSDILNHSCSQCWNCGKNFEGYGDKPVKRSNDIDRFKPFHNTCVRCHNPPKGNLFKEFGI